MDDTEQEQRRAWFRREILPLEGELRGYIRRLTRDPGATEDLLHDTFARIIATESWREVESPAGFAIRTARNVVYDALRRQKVVAIEHVADVGVFGLAADEADPEQALVARDELMRLRAIVEALPTQQRRVFTLRKVYGLPPAEIAERLGLSVSTVEKHLVKAVRTCAEALAREDAPPPKRNPWTWRRQSEKR
ncbi:MAG TPA: RNA polymerase sigma factor [Caulobacteraceae bacterium]